MKHAAWLLIALFATLTALNACSSHPEHRHDYDKTRSHADDAQRDLEREEQRK